MPDNLLEPALGAKTAFSHGDCRDSALGTLLLRDGVEYPEDLLFGELNFVVRRVPGEYRDLEILVRSQNAPELLDEAFGVRLEEVRHQTAGCFLEWLRDQIGRRNAVAITVDHWEYEHSQFFHSGHMPHHLLVTGAPDRDCFEIFDPYRYSRAEEVIGSERLLRWADAPQLEALQFYVFTLAVSSLQRRSSGDFLRDTWRETVRSNVESMLDGGSQTQGAAGIETVAVRLAQWCDSATFLDDVRDRRKLPTSSFLEVGAIRRGHARWLDRVAALARVPAAAEGAQRMRVIAQQWDVISGVRHLYQEANLSDGQRIDPSFLARKLSQLPRLIEAVAQEERNAAEVLARAVG